MKDTLKIFQSIVRNVLKFKFVEYVLNLIRLLIKVELRKGNW